MWAETMAIFTIVFPALGTQLLLSTFWRDEKKKKNG